MMILFFAALVQAQADSSSLIEVPFQYRAGLIRVRVSVPQSAKPLNFLLDSGAGVSVINLPTAQRLGLKVGERVSVRGVHSSTSGYWPTRLPARLGGAALPREYLAVDLRELGKACDCEVDGLIGADFFRGRVVQIDFMASKIRLFNESSGSVDAEVLPLKSRGRAFLVPVQINGSKPRWVRLDTGCASELQWVAKGTRPAAAEGTLSVGLSERNIPTMTTLVNLGSQQFESVRTGLHETAIFSGEAGLLGNGLLSRFDRVTIDAKGGKLMLQRRRTGQ
jgi:hypothetical protein